MRRTDLRLRRATLRDKESTGGGGWRDLSSKKKNGSSAPSFLSYLDTLPPIERSIVVHSDHTPPLLSPSRPTSPDLRLIQQPDGSNQYIVICPPVPVPSSIPPSPPAPLSPLDLPPDQEAMTGHDDTELPDVVDLCDDAMAPRSKRKIKAPVRYEPPVQYRRRSHPMEVENRALTHDDVVAPIVDEERD